MPENAVKVFVKKGCETDWNGRKHRIIRIIPKNIAPNENIAEGKIE
jgi:hypothetical protein